MSLRGKADSSKSGCVMLNQSAMMNAEPALTATSAFKRGHSHATHCDVLTKVDPLRMHRMCSFYAEAIASLKAGTMTEQQLLHHLLTHARSEHGEGSHDTNNDDVIIDCNSWIASLLDSDLARNCELLLGKSTNALLHGIEVTNRLQKRLKASLFSRRA